MQGHSHVIERRDAGPHRRTVEIHARLRSDPNFLEIFKAAVQKAKSVPFLTGAGDRGWRASFDWLLTNDTNVLAVIEGRYDGQRRSAWIGWITESRVHLADNNIYRMEAQLADLHGYYWWSLEIFLNKF